MNIKTMSKILIVDDDSDIVRIFSLFLREEGYRCLTAATGEEALKMFERYNPDIVLLDINLPNMSGIECLKRIKQISANAEIIIITAYETVQTAVEAMKLGAYDYLSKPLDNQKIKILIKNAMEKKELSDKIIQLRKELKERFRLDKVIGISLPMQKVFDLVKRIAPYNLAVLLQGESGTGKELIARTIHYNSPRADKPFVPIDCATLPETLVESELFGYERGAFTGAEKQKLGRFESANGGTLFLDEIGNLPCNVQTKLLRVLEEKEIARLGGKKLIKIDIRIITATNADLEEEMKKGKFRRDLYQRLKEFPINLPPLRERLEDINLLARIFLAEFNREFKKKIENISPHVMKLFESYPWPGNVREMKNTIRAAVILGEKNTIEFSHLPAEIQTFVPSSSSGEQGFELSASMFQEGEITSSFKEINTNVEKEYLARLFKQVKGNKSQAARIMHVDYKTLCSKLKRYQISEIYS